jgi:molecular chaperone GrpE (heat shock protein)
MSEPTVPTLAKWPFLLADLLFFGLAAAIVQLSNHPIGVWQIFFCIICVGAGAWLSITPFLQEYGAAVKLAETSALTDTVAQINNIGRVGSQIEQATAHWQTAQEQSNKTVAAAHEIAQRVAAEAKAFAEFLQKANDSEKANLRLEIEKLRRSEGDWLQLVVRLLDHVHALHQAGVRSGQPKVIEQLTQFQNACRDVARRVGLVPFCATAGEPFDGKLHQVADSEIDPPAHATIADTLATGFTFQGQLIRRALVTLQTAESETTPISSDASASEPAPEATQAGQGDLL